jgi:hypothetical protein
MGCIADVSSGHISCAYKIFCPGSPLPDEKVKRHCVTCSLVIVVPPSGLNFKARYKVGLASRLMEDFSFSLSSLKSGDARRSHYDPAKCASCEALRSRC